MKDIFSLFLYRIISRYVLPLRLQIIHNTKMVIPLIKEAMTDHQLVISVKSFRVIMLHKENAVMNSRQRIGKTSHSF